MRDLDVFTLAGKANGVFAHDVAAAQRVNLFAFDGGSASARSVSLRSVS